LDIIVEDMLHALGVIKSLAERHRYAEESGIARSHIEHILSVLSGSVMISSVKTLSEEDSGSE